MAIALVVAFGMYTIITWHSDSILSSAYQTHPAPENHRFVRITKKVSKKTGLPMPELFIIPSKSAVIICPENKSVTATEGILKILNDNELMSVIAHEYAHIVNNDSIIQTVTATISAAIALLSLFALFFGGNSNRKPGWVKTIALALAAPAIASIITMAVSRQKEYRADEFAGRTTGEPVALASALQKIAPEIKKDPMASNNPNSHHHFVGKLMAAVGTWEIFSTHPSVNNRIAKLNELAAELKK
jgi:heat shock protein HtpX